MKIRKPTIKGLKERGCKIEKIYYNDFIDSYTGKRHYGNAIVVIKDNEVLKKYTNKQHLYKDLAWARRNWLDIDEWLYL